MRAVRAVLAGGGAAGRGAELGTGLLAARPQPREQFPSSGSPAGPPPRGNRVKSGLSVTESLRCGVQTWGGSLLRDLDGSPNLATPVSSSMEGRAGQVELLFLLAKIPRLCDFTLFIGYKPPNSCVGCLEGEGRPEYKRKVADKVLRTKTPLLSWAKTRWSWPSK